MNKREMSDRFFRISHRMGRMKMMYATCMFGDITKFEFLALSVLYDFQTQHPQDRGMYVSALASSLSASPPAVSRMLRALERKGLITRSVDTQDRRNTFILLTRQGDMARQRAIHQMEILFQHVFEDMGEHNLELLLHLWNQLIDVMDRECSNMQKGEKEC